MLKVFLGLLLLFGGFIFMIVQLIMFIVKRVKKESSKKNALLIYLGLASMVIGLFLMIGDSSSNGAESNEEKSEVSVVEASDDSISETEEGPEIVEPLYNRAIELDLHNGAGTSVVGLISVIYATEEECTDEQLTDWYFNYVVKNDFNYCVIVYDENSIETKGVYSNGFAFLDKSVELEKEDDGTYKYIDEAGSTQYVCHDDTKTIEAQFTMVSREELNAIKDKVDSIIPDEYKGETYSIDCAGEVGGLIDCNICIEDSSFENADYEALTNEIANSVKELNLNIGYFNVIYQSDAVTFKANTYIDDLTQFDGSGIVVNEY